MRISSSPIGWDRDVPNRVTKNTAAVVTHAAEISHLAPHSLYTLPNWPARLCKMAARTAKLERKTNETQIEVFINLDCQPGSGNAQEIQISTGIGFLDHVRPFCAARATVCVCRSSDATCRVDVPCPREALRHVPDHEVPGRPLDRRSPHCRYVLSLLC